MATGTPWRTAAVPVGLTHGEPDAARAAVAYSRKVIAERRHFAPLYGYLCPCGGWHMTRRSRWDGVDHVLLYAIADHLQAFALGDEPAQAS